MYGLAETRAKNWFYGCSSLASVSGIANLGGLVSAESMFQGCTSLTSLDLRGLDASGLRYLGSMLHGCSGLVTILADAGWAMDPGASGTYTFYGCVSLVGGYGTAYDPTRVGAAMMAIDAVGSPGYLTAGS